MKQDIKNYLLTKEELLMKKKSVRSNGIYFLFDSDELVYIGSTVNFISRSIQHISTNRIKFTHYTFIKTNKFRELEISYIREYKPKYNKMHVDDIIIETNDRINYPDDTPYETQYIKCSILDDLIQSFLIKKNIQINYKQIKEQLIKDKELEINTINNKSYYSVWNLATIYEAIPEKYMNQFNKIYHKEINHIRENWRSNNDGK